MKAGARAPRVLIVDDIAGNVELARFVLDRAGLHVQCAGDGFSGLAAATAFDPDLVLLDIQMPRLDGLAVARALRREAGARRPVIVAFTAYAMAGDRERLLAAGCDAYLAKPIDVASFADSVRALLPAADAEDGPAS